MVKLTGSGSTQPVSTSAAESTRTLGHLGQVNSAGSVYSEICDAVQNTCAL